MKDDILISDKSQTHRTYLIVYGTVGICLFGYIIMTIRYIMNTMQIPWLDIATEMIILFFLLSVSLTRSTYELHEKDIVIICSSLFRTRTLKIPYSAIDGAFHFKVEPIKAISYRHTYRMYGSMDRRNIWSLVYNMPNTDKVSRVLMKASEEFWREFEKILPGRIRVEQSEVLAHAFRHISGVDNKKNKNRARRALLEDNAEKIQAAEPKTDFETAAKNAQQSAIEAALAPDAKKKNESLGDIAKELRK